MKGIYPGFSAMLQIGKYGTTVKVTQHRTHHNLQKLRLSRNQMKKIHKNDKKIGCK